MPDALHDDDLDPDHTVADALEEDVGEDGDGDQNQSDTLPADVVVADLDHSDDADPIIAIRAMWRRRRAHHRAEKSLILQRKAQERWAAVERIRKEGGALPAEGKYPKPTPIDEALITRLYPEFIESEARIRAERLKIEKALTARAKELPVYETFVKDLYGMDALGLAIIVGEAGDIGTYANPAKLWKRMGVGLVQTQDGENIRQRRATDKDLAELMGYDPSRRSALYTIGDALVKADPISRAKGKATNKRNVYRELYLEKKAYYQAREDFTSKMQAHRRAQRYMEKRLLRDLWCAWQQANFVASPNSSALTATAPETNAALTA